MITSIPETSPDNQNIRPLTHDPDVRRHELPVLTVKPGDVAGGLDEIAEAIAGHLNAASVRIWSLTNAGDRLQLRAAIGLEIPFDALQDNIPVDRSELGHVVSSGEPYVADCLSGSTPADVRNWAAVERVTTFIAVPVLIEKTIWGVVGLFTRTPIVDRQVKLLSSLSEIIGAGVALSDARNVNVESVDLLSSLVPCLSTAIVALNRQGLITYWSSTAEATFGWSRAEVLGKPLPVVPDERQHEYLSDAGSEPRPNGIHRGQTVCRRADQSLIHVQRTSAPLYCRNSEIVGRLELFSDDSQRIHTSRCLSVQARVARILAGSRRFEDAVLPVLAAVGEWLQSDVAELWRLDECGKSLSRSEVWAKSSGVRERLLAAEIRLKSDSADWPAEARFKNGVTHEADLEWPGLAVIYPTRGVIRVPVAGLAISIRRNGDRLGVVTCYGHSLAAPDDLTTQTLEFVGDALAQFLTRVRTEADLAEAEAKARQSQKMDAIGLLAGGVTHDFNNILTVILANSELGLDDVPGDHPVRELFAEIHDAGERAAAMTQQLLAVSRQQAARVVACDLNQLVDDMHPLLQRLVGPRITLDRRCDARPAIVQADVNQLEQVLLNLVVNASDAMPEGGTISIVTANANRNGAETRSHGARPGPYVELSVSDSGCGMDEETLSRIFDPFFTTKDVGRGTGMGLATVFGIVKQNEGFIQVRSQPNAGSTFSINLPQSSRTLATQAIHERLEASPTGTETVLIVENDESVRRLIRRLLEIRGYTVHEACQGDEALKLLNASKRHSIELVLAELQLPVVDGIALAREIARMRSRPKLLLLSANSEPPADLNLDVSRQFLRKPFTSADLARQVRLALDTEERDTPQKHQR